VTPVAVTPVAVTPVAVTPVAVTDEFTLHRSPLQPRHFQRAEDQPPFQRRLQRPTRDLWGEQIQHH
jgi:hypothetical protein